MTENVDNLILEHLRHIRGRVDQITDDMKEVKLRLSTLESSMFLVHRETLSETKPTRGKGLPST